MRTINLKMTEKEFESFFAMAEENAIMIGTSDAEEGEADFGKENAKRVKTVNRMLKYNRRREQINY